VRTRTSLTLLVGCLIASLVLFSVESLAQEQEKDAPDSAEIAHSPMNGPGDAQEVEAFFDELITKQLRKEHVAGATVAVVNDSRLVFAKGYGYADREQREPVVAGDVLLRVLDPVHAPARLSAGQVLCVFY
jgi:CubicO group peptidase (beta-lactamase class C family)